MKVKPVNPNAVIRDPQTLRQLPAEGAEVPDTTFWYRRLREGDVVLLEPPRSQPTGAEPIPPLTTRQPPHGGR